MTDTDAYEAGWRTAANWMERDDLIADIGSPAYIADRAAALASAPMKEAPEGLGGEEMGVAAQYMRQRIAEQMAPMYAALAVPAVKLAEPEQPLGASASQTACSGPAAPEPEVSALRVPPAGAIRRLIADDAYACTFQTMGQYRTALLKAIDNAGGQQ
jgi:hypothetical protein